MGANWGTSRIVVVSHGLAFKFPRVRLGEAWETLKYRFRTRSLWREFVYTVYQVFSLKWILLKGVVDNWKEYRFYRKTKHPFLQPTYVSLIGLLNIQRAGRPLGNSSEALWHQLYELTGGAVLGDNHHFENPNNFCTSGRRLRILDYGGPETQRIVSEFGLKIFEEFNLNYKFDGWEETS